MNSMIDLAKQSNAHPRIYHLLSCVCGALFIALMAQLSFPLWFTPVPLTLQSLAVLLVGAFLGSKKGALAVLIYLAEGAIGCPVFAGGMAGFAELIGPTGGYLLAFIPCAYLCGLFHEKMYKKNLLFTIGSLSICSLLTLVIGALWLSFYVGGLNTLTMGIYPFLIGDSLKMLAAAFLIASGQNFVNK